MILLAATPVWAQTNVPCLSKPYTKISGRWEYFSATPVPRGSPGQIQYCYRKVALDADRQTLSITLAPLGDGGTREYALDIEPLTGSATASVPTFRFRYRGLETGGSISVSPDPPKVARSGTLTFVQSPAGLRMMLGRNVPLLSKSAIPEVYENETPDAAGDKGVELKQVDCGPEAVSATPGSTKLTYGNERTPICLESTYLVGGSSPGVWRPDNFPEIACGPGRPSNQEPEVHFDRRLSGTMIWMKYRVGAGAAELRATCFQLADGPVNLGAYPAASLSRESECYASAPPPKQRSAVELSLRVQLPGRSFAQIGELRLVARTQSEEHAVVVSLADPTLRLDALPESIRLSGDPDFEDGFWPVKKGSPVAITLKPRSRTFEVKLVDAEDPARPIAGATVEATIGSQKHTLISIGNGKFVGVTRNLVRGDPVAIRAVAQGYSTATVPVTYGNDPN
jgi:hypothetical protein